MSHPHKSQCKDGPRYISHVSWAPSRAYGSAACHYSSIPKAMRHLPPAISLEYSQQNYIRKQALSLWLPTQVCQQSGHSARHQGVAQWYTTCRGWQTPSDTGCGNGPFAKAPQLRLAVGSPNPQSPPPPPVSPLGRYHCSYQPPPLFHKWQLPPILLPPPHPLSHTH